MPPEAINPTWAARQELVSTRGQLDAIVTEAIRDLPTKQRIGSEAGDVLTAVGQAVRNAVRGGDVDFSLLGDFDQAVQGSVARCLPQLDPLAGYVPKPAALYAVVDAAVRCVPMDEREKGAPVVADLILAEVKAVAATGAIDRVTVNGKLDAYVRDCVRCCMERIAVERTELLGEDFDTAEALPEGMMKGTVTKVFSPYFFIVEVRDSGADGRSKKCKYRIGRDFFKGPFPSEGEAVTIQRREERDEEGKDPAADWIRSTGAVKA